MDVHFNVISGVPEQAILTNGRTPEYQTLVENLLSGRFYVLDRACHCYEMMGRILAVGSDFLVRLRQDMLFEVVQKHPLSAADRLAGVLSVQTVRTAEYRGKSVLGTQRLKLVCMAQEDGPPMRLLTNRVDLDADLIGTIYRYR